MEPLTEELARKTVKLYVCSACWGDLETRRDPLDDELFYVTCVKCQIETKGYVTKYFVERRRNDNEFEKMDAESLLRRMGIIENPLAGKTEKDLLHELGY